MGQPRGAARERQGGPADVAATILTQPPPGRESVSATAPDDHVYDFVRTLAEGSYGDVHECVHEATGQRVAIKRFKAAHLDPQIWRLAMRELRVLQALPCHPHVVKLQRAVCSQSSGRLFFVFELLEGSLLAALDRYPSGFLPPAPLKQAAWQLLQGLAHCHDHGVVHRDVKPANVLVSGMSRQTGGAQGSGADGGAGDPPVVKLCDFGFARWLPSGGGDVELDGESTRAKGGARRGGGGGSGAMSAYVVTRWYRAPEVIVGDMYGAAVDIWSYGCTLAELATGQPLFPGCSSADQLWRMTRCLGSLPPALAFRCRRDGALAAAVAAPGERGRTLAQRLKGVSPPLLELITACLSLDPTRRPAARDLMRLPYFGDVHRPVQLAFSPLTFSSPPMTTTATTTAAAAAAAAVQKTAPPPPPVLQPASATAARALIPSSPTAAVAAAAAAGGLTLAASQAATVALDAQGGRPTPALSCAAVDASPIAAEARDEGRGAPTVQTRRLEGTASVRVGVGVGAVNRRTVVDVSTLAHGTGFGAATATAAAAAASRAVVGTAETATGDDGANDEGGGAAAGPPLLRRSVMMSARPATSTSDAVQTSITTTGLESSEYGSGDGGGGGGGGAGGGLRCVASQAARLLATIALGGGADVYRRLSGSFPPRCSGGGAAATASAASTSAAGTTMTAMTTTTTSTTTTTLSPSRRRTAQGNATTVTSPLCHTSVQLSASASALRQQTQQQQPREREQQQQQQQEAFEAPKHPGQPEIVSWAATTAALIAARGSSQAEDVTSPPAAAAAAAPAASGGGIGAGGSNPWVIRGSLASASEAMRSAIGAFLDTATVAAATDGLPSAPMHCGPVPHISWSGAAVGDAATTGTGPAMWAAAASQHGNLLVESLPGVRLPATMALPQNPATPIHRFSLPWGSKADGSGALASGNSHSTTLDDNQHVSMVIYSPAGVPSPSAPNKSPLQYGNVFRAVASAPPLPIRRGAAGAATGMAAVAATRAEPMPMRRSRYGSHSRNHLQPPTATARAAAGAGPATAAAMSLSTGGFMLSTDVSLPSGSFWGGDGCGGGGMVEPGHSGPVEATEFLTTSALTVPRRTAVVPYAACENSIGDGGGRAAAAAAAIVLSRSGRQRVPPRSVTAPPDGLLSAAAAASPSAASSGGRDSPAIMDSFTCDVAMDVRQVRIAMGSTARRANVSVATPPVSIAADADNVTSRCFINHRRCTVSGGKVLSLSGGGGRSISTLAPSSTNARVFPCGAKLLLSAAGSTSGLNGDRSTASGYAQMSRLMRSATSRGTAPDPDVSSCCRRGTNGEDVDVIEPGQPFYHGGGGAGSRLDVQVCAGGCRGSSGGGEDGGERRKGGKASARGLASSLLHAIKCKMRSLKARAVAAVS